LFVDVVSSCERRLWLTLRFKGLHDVPSVSTALNDHTFMLPVGVLEVGGHSVSRWVEKMFHMQCSVCF